MHVHSFRIIQSELKLQTLGKHAVMPFERPAHIGMQQTGKRCVKHVCFHHILPMHVLKLVWVIAQKWKICLLHCLPLSHGC